MGSIKKQPKVKLVIGFIFNEEWFYTKTKAILEKTFGKVDFESQTIDFTYTSYYEKEFGKGLKRKFISFKKLIPPEKLASIKILSNNIEKRLTLKNNRQINIDPGYLDMAKLVLATTKDFMHRIYLNCGIFAEITLFFQAGSFRNWSWTYPDYQSKEYIGIFNEIRNLYENQIKKV